MRLTKFTPPSTYGPAVSIDESDVVALEQAAFNTNAQKYRTLVRLRDGTTVLVDDEFNSVEALLVFSRESKALSKSPYAVAPKVLARWDAFDAAVKKLRAAARGLRHVPPPSRMQRDVDYLEAACDEIDRVRSEIGGQP